MSSSEDQKLPMDHHFAAVPAPPSSEHLCYVRCNFCSTVLAVVIPCKRLLDTVTVKCGHCSNVSFLTIRQQQAPQPTSPTTPPPPPPPPPPPHHNSSISTSSIVDPQLSLQVSSSVDKFGNDFMDHKPAGYCSDFRTYKKGQSSSSSSSTSREPMSPRSTFVVKPPEKKHRLPSAYNRFMKDEIQRIKTANPEIPHREAFSAAAKNWARHVPTASSSVAPGSSKPYGMK